VNSYNEDGIWVSDAGTLRMLARQGFEAPGTGGAYFKQFESIAMPEPNSLFFTARFWQGLGGVTPQSDRCLWAWRKETGLSRVLYEGQIIEDGVRLGRVLNFRVISQVPGSAGHGRYDGSQQSVDALVRFDNGRSAIMTVNAQGLITVVQRTGDEAENGVVLRKSGMPSSPGEGKLPVAAIEFTYSGSETRYNSIMDFEQGFQFASVGERAPGTKSENFLGFKDPVAGLGSTGKTLAAFEASLSGGTKETNAGIWLATGPEETKLVARKGMPAPGTEGMLFREFKSLSVIDRYGALFTASLSPGNDSGCWATDSNGALQLLLRKGDTIEGKTIRSFDVLTTVRGSEGQRRAWAGTSKTASVIFHATFTDGTDGLLTVSIP
jgi:hypothetical protein